MSAPTSGNNWPTWGVLIEGNEISDTLHGIASWWSRVEDPQREVSGPAMLNNIIRDNRITNSIQPVHVELMGLQEGPMLRANSMRNDGEAGAAVVFTEGSVLRPVLYPVQTEGPFSALFAGPVLPGGSVQVSRRLVDVTVEQGSSTTQFDAVAMVSNTRVVRLAVRVRVMTS